MYKLPKSILFIDMVGLLNQYLSPLELSWTKLRLEELSLRLFPVKLRSEFELATYSKFYERQYMAETGG
jgi:hypothetical protein